MRLSNILAVAAALTIGLAGAAEARTHHHSHRHYHSRTYSSGGYGGDYYTNVSGHQVHRPVFTNHAPAGSSARCRDGSYSFSEHHRGTCSHHGGVASWR